MSPEEKFNQLENYSEENLQGISKVIKIITNHLEFNRLNRLTNLIKIPLITLEKIGISYEEAQIIIGGINKINGDILITIINEESYRMLHSSDSGFMFPRFTDELSEKVRKRDLLREWLSTSGRFMNVFEDDLKNKLLLRLSTKMNQEPLEVLNNYKRVIDEKLAILNQDKANQIAVLQKRIENYEQTKITASQQNHAKEHGKDQRTKTKEIVSKRKIEKITIIQMNNGEHLIAVNDNYEETRKIKSHSDWWQIFIKEVKERDMLPETRRDVKEISRGMADYFNYNTIKCPIYMGGKYDPTNIFFGQSRDIMINSDIKTEILTEKQHLARKKKVRRE